MAPEKVTLMRLKVDLECSKCTKKVKKVLCKIPQVRAQVFDDKANIVNITVVCCDPEKIRDKICCKGGGAVKSIEIVEPKKPDDEKPKDKPAGGDKPKDKPAGGDKPKDKPAGGDKPKDKPAGDKPKGDGGAGDKPKDKPAGGDKPKGDGGDKPKDKPAGGDKPKNPGPVMMQAPPPVAVAAPAGMVVTPCYEGYPCGPYYYGYGQPTVVYDGYYGRPVYDSYGGGGRPVYVNRCDQYFNEENPQGCSIM